MRKFQDFWFIYGQSVLLVLIVTMLFFGPRLLTRYFEARRFNMITSAYDCAEDAEPYLLTQGC